MVFSLIPWSGRIRAEFHVHRTTWDAPGLTLVFAHPAVTVSGRPFQAVTLTIVNARIGVPLPPGNKLPGFGLLRFRSPLLAESRSFSFPGVTEMFHFAPSRFAGL